MTRWTRARAWCALATLLPPLLGGCDRSTAPAAGGPLSLVFLDNAARLNAVRGGHTPMLTGLSDVIPVASTRGKVAFLAPARSIVVNGGVVADPGGLRLYSLDDGCVDTLPVPRPDGGAGLAAISPDGSTMAYVSVHSAVYLVTVRLADNARDSVNLSVRSDQPAAVQVVGATPVYSPSGDSVAFLLPNPIGLQLLIYEVRSGRVEMFPVPVPVTTQFDATLRGWPRWTPDAAIRFLVRRRTPQVESDTLAVLKVFPRQPQRPAEVAFEGHPPSGRALGTAGSYSFDAAGTTVAFTLVGAEGLRIFVLRQGARVFDELAVGDGVRPARPLIVP